MKVINKQKEYVVIKIDYSEEMFINIGKYLKQNQDYKLEKNPLYSRKCLYIRMGNDFVQAERDCYLLIDTDNISSSIYASADNFKKDYIEIKEEE